MKIILSFIFCYAVIFSQTLDVDERFAEARKLAFDGKRLEAIQSLSDILNKYPDYADVRVFLARVYAWEKSYELAKDELLYVLQKRPDNKEAMDALSDVEFWSGNPHEALKWVNKYLELDPDDEKLIAKKEKIIKALGYNKAPKRTDKSGTLEERFSFARELAFSGERLAAIDSAKAILSQYPGYTDVRIFLARVYSWENRYDESREQLQIVLDENGNHKDALNAFIDNEMWSSNYDEALSAANKAVDYHPLEINFIIKKAKVHDKQKDYDEASAALQNALTLDPTNEEVLELINQLELKTLLKIGLSYDGEYFKQPFTPWQNIALSASKKFSFASITLRGNYARRFAKDGIQFESDVWFSVAEGIYAYTNAGFSGSKVFPKFRFGVEPYFKLPASFEASIGFRYLSFENSNVRIFTGHIGKYLGNFWIAVRPFITPKEKETSLSGSLIIRHYLSDVENYVSLQAGIGLIPFSNFTAEEFGRVDSRKIGVAYHFSFNPKLIMSTGLSYESEEYIPGKKRDKISFGLSIEQGF